MLAMTVQRAWYDQVQGYPILRLKLEGFEPTAWIDIECYRHLIGREWNAVFCGAEFADLLPPLVRGGLTLRGFSDDPAIVALAWQLIHDTSRSGRFVAGLVLIGE
jgi:hypothetical protein